jgi:uncharacterized protein YjbI with pentapeptide repeats
MGTLLLDKELRRPPDQRTSQKGSDIENDVGLYKEHDDVGLLSRAQTSTVLRGLSPERKGNLVWFLYEASLIQSYRPAVNLNRIDLSDVDLSAHHLEGACLSGANLCRANLRGAHLSSIPPPAQARAWLRNSLKRSRLTQDEIDEKMKRLQQADLRGADLREADLRGADLQKADLQGANLESSNLQEAKHLTQRQLNQSFGDEYTKLPGHLERPKSWAEGECSQTKNE